LTIPGQAGAEISCFEVYDYTQVLRPVLRLHLKLHIWSKCMEHNC